MVLGSQFGGARDTARFLNVRLQSVSMSVEGWL
jgi:hypothetical protein